MILCVYGNTHRHSGNEDVNQPLKWTVVFKGIGGNELRGEKKGRREGRKEGRKGKKEGKDFAVNLFLLHKTWSQIPPGLITSFSDHRIKWLSDHR